LNTKVYVKVNVFFREDGTVIPTDIVWKDGKRYHIDKVTDIRQAASLKVGGQGDRYTIMVKGRQKFLFFERSTGLFGSNLGRWFVEGNNIA